MISFGLPYPPAVNRMYAVRVVGKRAFPYKTHEHRDYEAAVERLWPRKPADAFDSVPVRVEVRLYRPRKAGDIDGPIKALFDVLNGRAWADDSQVVELHVKRLDDKHNPRVEVDVDGVAEVAP